MIVVALQGGLGNQMFQYACARHRAIKSAAQLKMDIRFYNNQTSLFIDKRRYELEVFKLNSIFANQHDLELFFPSLASNLFLQLYNRGKRKIRDAQIIKEKSLLFDKRIEGVKSNNIYLKGYWQSEMYFKESADIIRSDFQFKSSPTGENADLISWIRKVNSVSVHIRMGDFLKNPVHGVLPLTYYRDAMNLVKSKVPDPVFFLFSDDADWTRRNLAVDSVCVVVSHNFGVSDHDDLRLMQWCKHNIIANSSFSWWGAWLNSNTNKMVIAPKQWYSDEQLNQTTVDLIPSDWIRI